MHRVASLHRATVVLSCVRVGTLMRWHVLAIPDEPKKGQPSLAVPPSSPHDPSCSNVKLLSLHSILYGHAVPCPCARQPPPPVRHGRGHCAAACLRLRHAVRDQGTTHHVAGGAGAADRGSWRLWRGRVAGGLPSPVQVRMHACMRQ
jgi:hypothetical protein